MSISVQQLVYTAFHQTLSPSLGRRVWLTRLALYMYMYKRSLSYHYSRVCVCVCVCLERRANATDRNGTFSGPSTRQLRISALAVSLRRHAMVSQCCWLMTLCCSSVLYVVSRKRAHGWCTLWLGSNWGWADIQGINIVYYYMWVRKAAWRCGLKYLVLV